jgi:hypothetical protein
MFRISYGFSLVAMAALQSGCVITLVDGPGRESDGSDIYEDDWTTTTSGGNYGAGGAGGSTGTNPMGAGGSTVTTGSGMGSPASSSSSASGGPSCVGGSGTGEKATICEWLPAANANCGGAQPLGYGTCKRGFAIFKPASAEQLFDCLDAVPESAACDYEPVQKCIDRMYDDACPDAGIAATCKEWSAVCGQAGQPLDATRCTLDLNPFNAAAMNAMVECMNKTSGTCQQAYDNCFDQALSI